MKSVFVFVYFLFVIGKTFGTKICLTDSDVDTFWNDYKKLFGKKYSPQDDVMRKGIWEQHIANIIQHNLMADLGKFRFRKGVNFYTDLDPSEYKKNLLGYLKPKNATNRGKVWKPPNKFQVPITLGVRVGDDGDNYIFAIPGSDTPGPSHLPGQRGLRTGRSYYSPSAGPGATARGNASTSQIPLNSVSSYNFTYNSSDYMSYLPEYIDWRDYGAVTPVKHQGECGSCWAFSTTGSMEGQLHFLEGQLINLSEQNLLDCVTGNQGCSGGWMAEAFEYIMTSGIEQENDYPYSAVQGQCNSTLSHIFFYDKGYYSIPFGDEQALKGAVATEGPVSVAIDASQPSFQTYRYGVYDDPNCSTDDINHAVLVVGYGTEDGSDYWLIKNSWGTSWGIDGYMKLARNKNNTCGIANVASFPIL